MEKLCYDVAVIGGGASGIAAAIGIKKLNKNISVAVLEASDRILKKVLVTGNGRCNITNKDESIDRYHSKDRKFAGNILAKYNNRYIEDFFDKIGLKIRYEESGKAYPYSYQASSVVDVLKNAAEECGVSILTDEKVSKIAKNNNGYTVSAKSVILKARFVINASGLLSGTDKYVTDGSGLDILKKLGVKTEKTYPAIVQLKTENALTKQLKGIKVNGLVSVALADKTLRKEFGEVLFCDYGLSGPPVLQLSAYAVKNEGKARIDIDVLPEFSFEELKEILTLRKGNIGCRELKNLFNGFINKKIGEVIIKNCGLKLNEKIESLTKEDISHIAENAKKLSFKVVGDMGYRYSQATLGGVSTSEIDPLSMQLKKLENFYVIGELVDITGDCGGYNLKWAWASAGACADSIVKEYSKNADNK